MLGIDIAKLVCDSNGEIEYIYSYKEEHRHYLLVFQLKFGLNIQ